MKKKYSYEMYDQVKQFVSELGLAVNRYSDGKPYAETVLGDDKVSFAACYIGQLARCDGRFYPDYAREEKYNFEHTCSRVADARNDLAIRKASDLMQDPSVSAFVSEEMKKADFEPLPYDHGEEKTWMQAVMGRIRIDMHKTNQQSLCSVCIRILQDAGAVSPEYRAYLPMI